MDYITQKELREMMLSSYEKIEQEKEEINKINVFPVPDQDTGNNMAKTLLGVKEAIEGKEFKNLEELSEAILDGALTNAQGNAGVIYTGFLAGFLPQLDKNPIDIQKLALAFEKGAERARTSIQNPQEGTILDVIDASALALKKEAKKKSDIVNAFKKAAKQASKALLETREKMEIFKKANVVDAGGLGFLIIVESFLGALEKTSPKLIKKRKEKPSQQIKRFVQIIANRYEVVSLIENSNFSEKEVQKELKKLGNCLDIVKVKNKMKIHIHTDYPNEVKEVMRRLGQVQNLRVEDMSSEVIGELSIRTISIGVVTDNQAILLPKIIERYQIKKVDFVSQSKIKDYLTVFKKQLENFNKVLCLTTSSKISNSYLVARKAKEMLAEPKKVFVLDSSTTSVGQSLLVLRALELIQEQREMREVIEELKKLIPQTHLYIAIKDPKDINNKNKGITKLHISWIKKMKKINFHPIIEVKKGDIKKGGVVFAKSIKKALLKKILNESKKDRKKGKKIRVIIGYIGAPEPAKEFKKILKENMEADVSFITSDTSIIGKVLGPGTLIIGWIPI